MAIVAQAVAQSALSLAMQLKEVLPCTILQLKGRPRSVVSALLCAWPGPCGQLRQMKPPGLRTNLPSVLARVPPGSTPAKLLAHAIHIWPSPQAKDFQHGEFLQVHEGRGLAGMPWNRTEGRPALETAQVRDAVAHIWGTHGSGARPHGGSPSSCAPSHSA